MSRKLIALNLALAGLVVWAGFGLRSIWRTTKERERKELQRKTAAVPVPPLAPLSPPKAVVPQQYKTIADLFLWDRSRNADVPVEPPPAPPPEPPMPALPVYHGFMNIGDGPTAFMSTTASSPYEMVHPGETIGPFKLLSISQKEIELEWHGKKVLKTVDELLDNSQTSASSGGQQPDVRAAVPVAAVVATPKEPPSEKGPAEINQFGTASCQQNDSTPFGTVRDGMRKVQRVTPFATICLWEPVGGAR